MQEVVPFRSRRTIVTVRSGTTRHKVFQVFFGRDGSLFANFPYFRHRIGLLAATAIPANGQPKSNIDLAIGGKVASHLVKYSHHPDGMAHFSQDGKVRTEVRRRSLSLDEQSGHMFSVLIQGLQAFDRADDSKDVGSSAKRTAICFDLASTLASNAIKFVARWFSLPELRLDTPNVSKIGPIVPTQQISGKRQNGFLVASPFGNLSHVLLLTCEVIPALGPEPEHLVFYGGFDAPSIMFDMTKAAGFLAFLYPAVDVENLKKKIGTVDYTQSTP